MFCNNCGKEVKESDSYCAGCGNDLISAKPLDQQNQARNLDTNGLYRDEGSFDSSGKEKIYVYLRFFDDGTAVECATAAVPDVVKTWLTKGSKNHTSCKYKMSGSEIEINCKQPEPNFVDKFFGEKADTFTLHGTVYTDRIVFKAYDGGLSTYHLIGEEDF